MEIEEEIFDEDFIHDIEMSDDELREELDALEKEESEKRDNNVKVKMEIKEELQTHDEDSYNENERIERKRDEQTNDCRNIERTDRIFSKRKEEHYDKKSNYSELNETNSRTATKGEDGQIHSDNDEKISSRIKEETHETPRNNRDDRRTTSYFSENNIDKYRLFRRLDVSKDMDPMIVGREIAYRLHEKKMNLIGHVVRVIGFGLSIEVFEETKKIIKSGGLKTDSGDRKRSPGGIYLYILKNRGYASNKQMKEIFKIENEKSKEFKKKKAQLKRVEKRKYMMDEDKK